MLCTKFLCPQRTFGKIFFAVGTKMLLLNLTLVKSVLLINTSQFIHLVSLCVLFLPVDSMSFVAIMAKVMLMCTPNV